MAKQNILSSIDPELSGRLTSRRELFGKAALALGAFASAPVVLSAVSQEAFGAGKVPQAIADVLNFALTLEYVEDGFYRMGLASRGLIPAKYRKVFRQIGRQETAHVAFLKG